MRARLVAVTVGIALLQACGRAGADRVPAPASPGPERRYVATATVLEGRDHLPMLCLGQILASLPPSCGDVPITNWNWDEVRGKEQVGGVTWGEYHVVGTYDGASFTVLEVGQPEEPVPGEGDTIGTPCTEPDGGWVAVDPARTTEPDMQAARRTAQAEPDFAGLWIDYITPEPDPEHPGPFVLNVAFTGTLERHRAELRDLWGGPLCVIRHERTYAELRRIQDELSGGVAKELGLHLLWTDTDVVHDQVEIGAVVIDPETQAALDSLYGAGAVRVSVALQPVG